MLLLGSNVIIVAANRINYSITSARFIAKERALVKWSQLQLFKAKERRGYLQRISLYKYSSFAALHRLC